MHLPLQEAVNRLQATSNYPKLFGEVFGSDQITSENIAKALAQFERILISSNSKYDKYLRGEVELSAEEKLGMDLFMTHPAPENNLRGGNCGVVMDRLKFLYMEFTTTAWIANQSIWAVNLLLKRRQIGVNSRRHRCAILL